jgi:hypothetical protein
LQDVAIVDTGDRYDTETLARSLIIRRQKPVAVVLTGDDGGMQEQCRSMQRSLESVAINTPVKAVFLAPHSDLVDGREVPMAQDLVQFLQRVRGAQTISPSMDEVA